MHRSRTDDHDPEKETELRQNNTYEKLPLLNSKGSVFVIRESACMDQNIQF